MRGKRIPPTEPVTAHIRTVLVGRLPTGRALNCGRCGQRLPTIQYLRLTDQIAQAAQRNAGGLSPNHLYIDWREMPGWVVDGETLRPTDNHRERRQRAREKVNTTPSAETKPTRLKLAGRSRPGKSLVPHEQRMRQNVLFGRLIPVPQRIECSRCHVENLLVCSDLDPD